jgi:4-hydroxybenzoate polyprenyltransferase
MEKIKNYFKLLRVNHYLKNFLVLLPLVFSSELLNLSKLKTTVLGFIAFCLTASIVYIINDLKDIENDKKHPVKKNRPFASGKVSKVEGIIILIVLTLIVLGLSYFIGFEHWIALLLLGVYLLLNVFYSFGLKNVPIVDIVILVSGFFIRVVYGAQIIDLTVSNWMYLTVISASFYMGLGKRRNEIIKQGNKSRKVLKYYTKEFLDKNMYVFLGLCIVFYALWAVDPTTINKLGNNLMIWTVPFIMIILMKYSLNVEGNSFGDPVDVILHDKSLLAIGAIYALSMFGIIYIL